MYTISEPIEPLSFSSRIRRATLCAFVATLIAFVCPSAGADPDRWRVEFLGDTAFQAAPAAAGDNWEFRATHVESGATKVFESGTERGWFLGVFAYGKYALVDTDVGSGARGFTIYDLEANRKIVEIYTMFPHLSPDRRYLIYRQFTSRGRLFKPHVKIIDLNGDLGKLEIDDLTAFRGVGDVVFPPPPPQARPELAGAYGTTVAHYDFETVAWDTKNNVFFFTAADRTNHLNLVVLSFAPSPAVVCYVPITQTTLNGEYFEEKSVHLTGLRYRPPGIVVVATTQGFSVTSEHRVALFGACRDQNPAYAESINTDHTSG